MVFDSGCTNLNSHQQCTRVFPQPFFTFSLTFITSYLFENSHSQGVRWYLIVVLTCISLMVSVTSSTF